MDWLWVAMGGALGSVARFGVGRLARMVGGTLMAGAVPLGTLIVNVVGCFFAGVLGARGLQGSPFLMTGVLGGFTTFSAFGLETWQIGQLIGPGAAALNVAVQLIAGLAGVGLGTLTRS